MATTRDWRGVAALNPHGLLQITFDGRQRLLGPIKEMRVEPDKRVIIVPKWLCEELHDRFGRLVGYWRVPNRVIEFEEGDASWEAKTVSGVQVVEFHGVIVHLVSGEQIDGVIEVEPSDRLDPAKVIGLQLDENGCEPAPWWFRVPGLVGVSGVRLEQHFPDERGVVVNDMPITWVDMLMQGAAAYVQPERWSEGYGDQCNAEFKICFELAIEPHLVAHAPSENMMPNTVATALRGLATSWGGVTVEWTGWVDKPVGGGYGIHAVTLGDLLNSFVNGLPEEDQRRLLGFDDPAKLDAAEHDWSGNLRVLALYLEQQIRQHFDLAAVEAHLTYRGVPMPQL